MLPRDRYRRLMISIIILTLAVVCFFSIRSIFITPPLKLADQHPHATPTRLVGSSQVLPTFTPSVPPTPVTPHILQISDDPYTNSSSQHKTEVEPASSAYGFTIVTAFQAGRFFNHGSSNIGWATSTDGGTNWQHGFLPATTIFVGGQFGRITDPSVAYDAMHHTWIIASIAFLNTSTIIASTVLVSLST